MPKTKSAIRKVRAEQQGVAAQLLDSAVSNHPSVEKAKSRLRRAFLDYRRRNVVAPVAGYIAKRMVQMHILAQVEHSFWRNLNTYSESR